MTRSRGEVVGALGLFAALWVVLLLPLGLLESLLHPRLPAGLLLPGGLTLFLSGLGASLILLRREGRTLGAIWVPRGVQGATVGVVVGTAVGALATLPVAGVLAVPSVGQFLPGELGSWSTWLEGGRVWIFLLIPAGAEELLLRGFPLLVLVEGVGVRWAVAATSVVFGLLHLGNPGLTGAAMMNLILAGVVLALVVLRTGSLWWATGVHLGWNWGTWWVLGMPVSGLAAEGATLFTYAPRGPDWLAGGAFGLEGSVVAALWLMGVALLLRFPRAHQERRWILNGEVRDA